MKKSKRLLSLAITVLTAVSLFAVSAFSAFADETTYTITIKNTKTGHTYAAYQIFDGELDSKGKTLSNVTWGSGVDSANIVAALAADETIGSSFESTDTAADVAEAVADFTTDQLDAFAQVVGKNLSTEAATVESSDGTTTISGLAVGYYLVKDTAKVSGEDAATKFIVELVNDVEVSPKSSTPEVTKKVQDNNDFSNEGTDLNDVADYNIGDSVPFTLTGTMPSTIADYDTYKYIFHDTLSDGLTYNNDVNVTIDGTDITSAATTTYSGTALTISYSDILAAAENAGVTVSSTSKVVVTYTATLNENAVIGLDGNPNEVYLEFSNNPNQGGEGETGTTPEDQVLVFTYELDVNKVDGEDTTKKLAGAEFTLQNADGKYAKVKDGKLVAWVASTVTDDSGSTTLTSDSNGLFTVKGIDEGKYTLIETKAPDGYNLLSNPITLTFTANDDHDAEYLGNNASTMLTSTTLKVGTNEPTATSTVGVAETNVENNSGSVLPSTGGIGTTIFFVVGGIVVAAAVVILIARKRAKDAE